MKKVDTDSHQPMIIAHRGASGHAPENSLEAFRLAASMGAGGVELDVHATLDGAIVVFHDPIVPGVGPISECLTDRIRQARLPNGEPVPLLSEVLSAIPALTVWIEVKGLEERWDARLLEVIDGAANPGRCAVHSFDHRLVARLGSRQPSLQRGVLSASYLLDPASQLAGTGATVLWQEWRLIDRDLVDAIHGAGARVFAWTVNEQVDAEHLRSLGVDGLCGNYPERLRVA
jgi:glycerophosphoryl diester phosphodiesterase